MEKTSKEKSLAIRLSVSATPLGTTSCPSRERTSSAVIIPFLRSETSLFCIFMRPLFHIILTFSSHCQACQYLSGSSLYRRRRAAFSEEQRAAFSQSQRAAFSQSQRAAFSQPQRAASLLHQGCVLCGYYQIYEPLR